MKVKTQKGITLMALIITIVVLLIIATTAITSIKEYQIIDIANSAANQFNNKVAIENSKFDEYNQKLDNYGGGPIGGSGSSEETGDDSSIQIKVGEYVEYDVSYTDIYINSIFTSQNGWRYLGQDDEGNKLLISTAIPMILYYKSDVVANWWDSSQTNTNAKMVEGLKKNLANIPYTKVSEGTTSTSNANTMIGLFGDSNRTTVGDYFESATYAGQIKNIRTLTLAELNRAINNANGNNNRADNDTSSGYKSLSGTAEGLFNMYELKGYGAQEMNYKYWLATSYTSNSQGVHIIDSVDNQIFYATSTLAVIRPVVVLSSDVKLVYNINDKIFKIRAELS